jgi:hypothetical protein
MLSKTRTTDKKNSLNARILNPGFSVKRFPNVIRDRAESFCKADIKQSLHYYYYCITTTTTHSKACTTTALLLLLHTAKLALLLLLHYYYTQQRLHYYCYYCATTTTTTTTTTHTVPCAHLAQQFAPIVLHLLLHAPPTLQRPLATLQLVLVLDGLQLNFPQPSSAVLVQIPASNRVTRYGYGS